MATIAAFFDSVEHMDKDADDEWYMIWARLSELDGCAKLRTLVFNETIDPFPSVWEIEARGHREVCFKSGRFDQIALESDHPLLWGHTMPTEQLNFIGPPGPHESLLWRLYERHRQVVGDYIPFDRHVQSHFIGNRLSGGGGVLAEGPTRLLRTYADVLAGSDLEPYFPYPTRPAVRWDEARQWVVEDAPLAVLILGESYLVAEEFSANRES